MHCKALGRFSKRRKLVFVVGRKTEPDVSTESYETHDSCSSGYGIFLVRGSAYPFPEDIFSYNVGDALVGATVDKYRLTKRYVRRLILTVQLLFLA